MSNDKEVRRRVRRMRDTLWSFAHDYPDFKFVEFQGPGVARRKALAALIDAFVGRDTTVWGEGDANGIPCFYGDDVDVGRQVLSQVTDSICVTIRDYQSLDGKGRRLFPIVRGSATVFQLAHVMLEIGRDMAECCTEAYARHNVTVTWRLPQVYDGSPILTAGGDIMFPGDVLGRQSPHDPGWSAMCLAVKKGQFKVRHTLDDVFAFCAFAFHALLGPTLINRDLQKAAPVPLHTNSANPGEPQAIDDPTTPSIILSKNQEMILSILAASRTLMLRVDLEAASTERGRHISQRSISTIVKPLVDANLVERPDGERAGMRITPLGRRWLAGAGGASL